MASAMVFSPMTSYQLATGSWEAMRVDFRLCQSIITSMRFIRIVREVEARNNP
jgi:hypothetical protein